MAYTYAGLFYEDDGRLVVVVVSGFKEEGGALGAGCLQSRVEVLGMRYDVIHYNAMRGHPYRSKMACTPAMAFRLFSSLEGEADFSAGPGAGIAGGRRRLPDHEKGKADRCSNKQVLFGSIY